MAIFSKVATFALFLLASISMGYAETPEEKGYAIAKRAKDMTNNYTDYSASGVMTLKTGGGGESVRKFDFKARNIPNGNQNLLVFAWPGDIRDTGLLTIGATGRTDNQWIYLPAAQQVKRISSSSRSGSFVGSEFAYEDMVDQGLDDYDYKWVRDEGCCHVVETYPKFSSGYEKEIVWFDIKSGLASKVEFFPKHGSKTKVLTFSGYRDYGKVWRSSLMHMENQLNGRSTDLEWSNYKFNVGLADSEFSTRALERGQ